MNLCLWATLVATFGGRIWYMFPLCLVIALVYQATRRERMGQILRSGLRLFLFISAGMLLAALVLYGLIGLL